MPAELPFFGICPHEIFFDAVLEFDVDIVWNNWLPRGQFYRQEIETPLLRAGYWNISFSQSSPTSWVAHRPGFDELWLLGNYKINGTTLAQDLVILDDQTGLDANASTGHLVGPFPQPVGTFTLGIGNVLIETIPPCGCSARDAGADTIQFIFEKDLDLSLSDIQARGIPEEATIKIHGERQ